MLEIKDLTYRIAGRDIFDEATVRVDPGHRVGFVGRNGTGKTTLLKLISGDLGYDGGNITYPERWKLGITKQEVPDNDDSLLDTVLAADAERNALLEEEQTCQDMGRLGEIHARMEDIEAYSAPARAAEILSGLGFNADTQTQPCHSLSGGMRMRVALAGLLFTRPDLLLLDEPTNHLDLESAIWFESVISRYHGTILLVSHERSFLNNVCDQIIHLTNKKLTLYRGNYDQFQAVRSERLSQQAQFAKKQEAKRAHMMKFVDRFRYKASKAKQAQSRLKLLEKMETVEIQLDERTAQLQFADPGSFAPPMITMDKVAVGYEENKPVLKNLSLRIDPDDRIALLGANGNGKSTLAKLIAGKLKPQTGDIVKPSKLRVGYFAQHQTDEFNVSMTPLQHFMSLDAKMFESDARNWLGRFGYDKDRADTKIGDLSGGEKARLLLALIAREKPHILLLDEPTNHLDIDMRRVLVDAINDFVGAVILVTHDFSLLELTADQLWLVDQGTCQPFDGDLNQYKTYLTSDRSKQGSAANSQEQSSADQKKAKRQAAAQLRQALKPLKNKLDKAEKNQKRLEAEKVKLDERMLAPDFATLSPDQLVEHNKKYSQILKDLTKADEDWLEAWDNYEQAEAKLQEEAGS